MCYRDLKQGDKVKVVWSGCSLYGQVGIVDKLNDDGFILVKGFTGPYYYGRFKRGDLFLIEGVKI